MQNNPFQEFLSGSARRAKLLIMPCLFSFLYDISALKLLYEIWMKSKSQGKLGLFFFKDWILKRNYYTNALHVIFWGNFKCLTKIIDQSQPRDPWKWYETSPHCVHAILSIFVIKSVFDSTWIRINWVTPCKIRENSGFRWPVFSRIKTEFTILSMYGKIPVRKIPVFSHILCIVIPGYS